MKRHVVRIIEDAERDLIDICGYVSVSDSETRARFVLDRLEALCQGLAELPERGHVPPELARIGVRTFREVHFKPFRVIYQVIRREVFVHCVLDGRRDMQALLERRLLR